jgi:hypothetical protein
MPDRTDGERIDRLEQIVQIIAEDHLKLEEEHSKLEKIVAEFATETRRAFDQVAEQMHETREVMRENARYFDERVDKLVSAMGEYIRQNKAN